MLRDKAAGGGSGAASALVPFEPGSSVAEARIRLRRFNAALLASNSATITLERWSAGSGAPVLARRKAAPEKPPTPAQRERLQIAADEPVIYRCVELACGGRILSEAENWYVPRRLTADILATLDHSDLPFGRAVTALAPRRETFLVEALWPSPDGGAPTPVPWRVLRHAALVRDVDGRAFSEVNEVYTREILAFGPPVSG